MCANYTQSVEGRGINFPEEYAGLNYYKEDD